MKNLALLWMVCLALLSGCGTSPKIPPQSRPLSLILGSEFRTLEPGMGIDSDSQLIIKMVSDGLMTHDLSDKLIPSLAERVEISKNKQTYTFHLREAYWTNGDPVCAEDFAYAWRRVIAKETRALAAPQFFPIKNVPAILRGEKAIKTMGVSARDARTLVVELEHPSPYFLEMVANTSFFPVPSRLAKENPKWMEARGAELVCCGPFTLKQHRINNEILLEKNERFWDAAHVRLPAIQIAIIREESTQLALFEHGKADYLGRPCARIPLDALPTLIEQGKVERRLCKGVQWCFLNTEALPFTNTKMRKAFSYAINRQKLASNILQDGEKPACAILDPSFQVHSEGYFPDNAIAEAASLFQEGLNELGITKEQLPPITLSYPMNTPQGRIAQAIQQMWQTAFQIPISLESQEWQVYYQKIASGSYQIGLMGWVSWMHDPIYMMMTFKAKGGINMSRWEDPVYTQLLDATNLEFDPAKRRELFHAAQTLLIGEMPVIPLYFLSASYMKNEALKDILISEINQIDFRYAYFAS